MVTIIDFAERKNSEGESFYSLIVEGGLEMVKSKSTGKFYATSKRTSLPSTFGEDACKELIGTKIPGTIEKVHCEPYEYTIRQTGEVITLDYRWLFVAEGETIEETVFEGKFVEA